MLCKKIEVFLETFKFWISYHVQDITWFVATLAM